MTSKRQRDSDDSDDVDYAPNLSEMAAASSVGDAGDESSEEETEGVEDDVTDLMGLDLPSRQWTAESYANARAVDQFSLPRDTNILFFKTVVQNRSGPLQLATLTHTLHPCRRACSLRLRDWLVRCKIR